MVATCNNTSDCGSGHSKVHKHRRTFGTGKRWGVGHSPKVTDTAQRALWARVGPIGLTDHLCRRFVVWFWRVYVKRQSFVLGISLEKMHGFCSPEHQLEDVNTIHMGSDPRQARTTHNPCTIQCARCLQATSGLRQSEVFSISNQARPLQPKNELRQMTEEEELQEIYGIVRKTKRKGYVRLVTSAGMLNIELHCDFVPRTTDNFIRLSV